MKKTLLVVLSLFLLASVYAENKIVYQENLKTNITNLDITLYSEKLIIKESNNNKIEITIFSNDKKQAPNVYTTNDELSIKANSNNFSFGYYCKVELSIPENYKFKHININSTSGSVHIEKLFSKDISIKSTSGSINSDVLSANNKLSIKSTSGSFKVNDIDSDDLQIISTSGSINIHNLNAIDTYIQSTSGSINAKTIDSTSIEARTTSGSISISNLAVDDFLVNSSSGRISLELYCNPIKTSRIHSTSGSVNLKFPANEGFNIDFSSTSGSFNDNITGSRVSSTKGYSTSYFGGGTNIIVSTTSGSLTIR